ncbi:hypothetical protein SAMN04515691_0553 [Leifsonia sp. 98AMF]|uniref:hypothetical protein n=1 Tax=unclassified Leifsonia TaxID=2663824 RepID=UPI0008793056|nr:MULTISPECIES: hypothetical protein [unclassified Leifsonia]SDH64872.1 hypothetical protein SAMN04515690_3466 [Leifsonia sp. 197AMF]SDI74663.1 hypothetical protein SAMN04515684_0323 [Leifsonia sp. 466MF]SDK13251.1 hypothetical protein SAMN04515683_2427 [Leifsonia sp. 157MF]SDN77793.1 hypothetical protein SAMN04515686_2524 [Leifsonia sp. 509MF]SEN29884.1 hypothetical protein SAMN04515685_2412 [Leifsonia sp. 467MF]
MNAPLPDTANLPRFLDHLQARDTDAALLARQLLDAGAAVIVFWGPQQMDVWELRVQVGDTMVRFGVERGYSDGVLVAPAGYSSDWSRLVPLRLAVIAWARANNVPLPLDDPDEFDPGLTVHGRAVLDWVDGGHFPQVERVRLAWAEYRRQLRELRSGTLGRPDESELRAVRAAGVAAIEAAAAPLAGTER